MGHTSSFLRLVCFPALVALAVTLLRLIGELSHWARPLVSSALCGKGILGVVWLVPFFGIYFAAKLFRSGHDQPRLRRAFAYAGAALALKLAGAALMETPGRAYAPRLLGNLTLTTVGMLLPAFAWPQLFKALLVYGYASRIPVAVVQFLAMRGHWGTHYDALDPDFPAIGFWATYIRVSLVPNLYFMEAYTVIVGALFGTLALGVIRGSRAAPSSG